MLKTNVDARALRILLKYDTLAAGYVARGHPLPPQKQEYVEKHATPSEDLDYAKKHGLAFYFVEMNHDQAIQKCFEHYALLEKELVTSSFLASFSSNRLDWRSGLAAYAIMQTMPQHSYRQTPAKFCEVCSAAETKKHLDLTGLNQQRFAYGSLISEKTPYQIQFLLEQHSKLEKDIAPIPSDFAIFNAIIRLIESSPKDATPTQVMEKLKTVEHLKANLEQCRCLLEILGFCSILETEQHSGYLTKYMNPGLAPSKTHRSDWAYPVDFWTGKNGINRDAFQFWFGNYREIKL